MFSKLFQKKESEKVSFVGRTAKLVHDATVFQTGTIFIDDVRCSVKTEDGSELCAGVLVKVIREESPHLIVEKIEGDVL